MSKRSLRQPARTKRNFEHLEARRRQGMQLLAAGRSQAQVARQCGVSEATVSRWNRARRENGALSWQRRRLGRPPKLTPVHLARLEAFLRVGAQAKGFATDLWTLPRISAVLERETGLRLHPGHLWRVLIQLGWSVQKPEGRATQRDEAAIARWKRHTWPALKKSPV